MFKISKEREITEKDIISIEIESDDGDITASVEIDRDVYFSNLTEDELDDVATVTIRGLEYDFTSDKWKCGGDTEVEILENEDSYQKCILTEAEIDLISSYISSEIYDAFGREQKEVCEAVRLLYDKKIFVGETFITDAVFLTNKELDEFLHLDEFGREGFLKTHVFEC